MRCWVIFSSGDLNRIDWDFLAHRPRLHSLLTSWDFYGKIILLRRSSSSIKSHVLDSSSHQSLGYCILFAPRTAWGGFTKAACQELGPNFRFGLAGFTMIASEWWCWEIVGLSSSLLGPSTLAAQSVISWVLTHPDPSRALQRCW